MLRNIRGFNLISIYEYDRIWPSVFRDINEGIWDQCGIYFATKSSFGTHHKIHGRKGRTIKIKRKRISAHREDEMLCVIDSNTEFDDFQWLSINDVDAAPQEIKTAIVRGVEIIKDVP